MKLGIVGPIYPWRGGIAHYTALLAAQLGVEHTVRVYSFHRLYPNWLFPGSSQYEPGPSPLAPAAAHFWLTPWWPPSWGRVLRDWIDWKPDILVLQWWVPFLAPMTAWLAGAARRHKIPAVIICHNVLPHEHGWLDSALARWALRRATGLVVHSAADQQAAQDLLPQQRIRTAAFPNYAAFGTNDWSYDRARAELQVTGRVLLFFGLVRPYKGLAKLIEALPAVLQDGGVTLLIVGEIWGPAEPYHRQIEALQLGQHVRFISRYVSNEEAALYFSAADLMILPYLDATGSAAVQMAFAFGLPVVATRAGSMAETVEDGVTGFLVDPGDVAGLSGAICRYFNEGRGAAYRAAIAQQRERFSWTAVSEAVLQIADGARVVS